MLKLLKMGRYGFSDETISKLEDTIYPADELRRRLERISDYRKSIKNIGSGLVQKSSSILSDNNTDRMTRENLMARGFAVYDPNILEVISADS